MFDVLVQFLAPCGVGANNFCCSKQPSTLNRSLVVDISRSLKRCTLKGELTYEISVDLSEQQRAVFDEVARALISSGGSASPPLVVYGADSPKRKLMDMMARNGYVSLVGEVLSCSSWRITDVGKRAIKQYSTVATIEWLLRFPRGCISTFSL